MASPRRLVVGPFNRVEGDLEVRLEIETGSVLSAQVNSPLYRGFEQILQGKDPLDALVYAPRICGICSVSQSIAAAAALADLQGLEPSRNGELAVNLIAAVENLADHFTHYYLFFAPDFAREIYAGRDWYAEVGRRYRALHGSIAGQALSARAELLRCMGLLAGKWPHSLAIQAGGSTRSITRSEKLRLQALIAGFRRFLEQHAFADSLEAIVELDSVEALSAWREQRAWNSCDLAIFLHVSDALGLHEHGRGYDRFLSFGAYSLETARLFRRGVWDRRLQPLDVSLIAEDIAHSWLGGANSPLHPAQGVTLPDADKDAGYTWCKAPRLDGQAMETGALARQMVDGQRLMVDWVRRRGGSVAARVLARLLELARVTLAMEEWVQRLQPDAPFCVHAALPEAGSGCGLTEAARGALGHWVEIRHGRILNYQIISPTTWNFSPRDRLGQPGALEKALIGAPVGVDETTPIMVQHIVRSFDPCMVCTVH